MDKIRDLLSRFSSGPKEQAPVVGSSAGTDAQRATRADQITGMQENVSRLQTEIAELSHGEAGGVGAQMTQLEGELTKTQQELARIQGRV